MKLKGTLSKFFIFATGAAIGSVVTWRIVKSKYEQIAREEIESVKAAFSDRQSEPIEDDTEYRVTKEKPDLKAYTEMLAEVKYAGNTTNQEKEEADVGRPYTIAPEEFGDIDDYETISLNYYADGILADDFDERIEDIDEVVGLDSLNTFGEYEDDSVFVRNDALKRDYEILKDHRRYVDVVSGTPYQVED